MKERPILFSGAMVRAILEGRKTRKKVYPRPGETETSPSYLARRLAGGLDSAPEIGCWVWMRSAKASGHATMRLGGRTVLAYRVAFELAYGPIPLGKWVLHRCDNPRCIRPDHLELGDQSKNMADCAQRGRSASGARNGRSRLSAEAAREIRLLAGGDASQDVVAARFGITGSTVGRIWRGESWK